MIKLKPTSWKIMLEVLVKASPTKVQEVPIQFDERQAGESKFNWAQMRAYIKHLIELIKHKYHRVIKFGVVGLGAAGIHFTLLYVFTDITGLWYILSAILSIIVASSFAYALHHKWTFRGRTISNHAAGWSKYQVLSGISDAMYLGLLALYVEIAGCWYILGAFLAALTMFPIKYGVAATLIWEEKRDPDEADYDWTSFYKGNPVQKWWKQSIANTVWKWIPDASRLLDVGCGSSPIISKYKGATGIDASETKVDFMKHKLGNFGNGSNTARFAVMSATELDFPDNFFEHVLCVELVEHLEEPEKAISEIARVLKPGGNAVIATPDYNKPWWHLAERFTPTKEQHTFRFSKTSLDELCECHGLNLVKCRYVAGCDYIGLYRKEDE